MALGCDRVRELSPGFVLGALEPAEMAAVREHLAQCQKPHPELRELGGVLPYLAETIEPVEPPARLRTAILAAAQGDLRARRRSDAAAERLVAALGQGPAGDAAAAGSPLVAGPQASRGRGPRPVRPTLLDVPTPVESPVAGVETGAPAPAETSSEPISLAARVARRRRAIVWLTSLAAVFVIVALAGYTAVIQGDLAKAKTTQDHLQKWYGLVQVPDSRTAVLKPAGESKAAGQAVIVPTGHVAVFMHGLERTKGTEVYSVWLSANGSGDMNAGSFTVDETGEGYLEAVNVPSGVVEVMVSREAKAGAKTPKLPLVSTGAFQP